MKNFNSFTWLTWELYFVLLLQWFLIELSLPHTTDPNIWLCPAPVYGSDLLSFSKGEEHQHHADWIKIHFEFFIQIRSGNDLSGNKNVWYSILTCVCGVTQLIIYMKKYSILIGWEQCSFSLTQCRKGLKVIKQAFWLVNEKRSSQIANQIFCFQIKRAPWMAQSWRNFFLIAW